MDQEFIQLKNLKVYVDEVSFVPNISDPPLRPYGFVYFISIENNSGHTVQLLARKWIVKENSGETIVVEGKGIVGETPILKPGDAFSYNSCHVVGSDAVASGSFFGEILSDQRKVAVRIPEFQMKLP